jgi:hypothetical protein
MPPYNLTKPDADEALGIVQESLDAIGSTGIA